MQASLPHSYDYSLVALSIGIAILSSYAALDLGERTAAVRGKFKQAWLTGGALAMGVGIWAMHYIGMLAFRLPLPISYDVPTVILSLAAAIIASAVALYVVSGWKLTNSRLLVGGTLMGAGIATMHYTGMAAMRLSASCHYNPTIVAASLAIAIVVSIAALSITFHLRTTQPRPDWLRLVSASVMGLAIAGMHYTGMAAASFKPGPASVDASAVNVTALGIATIAIVTILVLAVSIGSVFADRKISTQTQALSNSKRTYQTLFNRSLAGVYQAKMSGDFLDLNEASLTMLGYDDSTQALTTNIRSHFLSEQDERLFFDRLMAESKISGYEACLQRRDGSRFWCLQAAALIETEDGQSPTILCTIIDISDRKRSEAALESAMRAAQTANDVKSQFLANISHEVRTPMNGIIGMTDLVLETKLTDEQRELLVVARQSADSLMLLWDELLDFSQIAANSVNLLNIEFAVYDSVQQAMDGLTLEAGKKGLEMVLHEDSKLPELVYGDPVRLKQVLTHVIGNAIKFTQRGRIDIHAHGEALEAGKALVQFEITDTGIGIPTEMQDRIFEAFSQADDSNGRRYGGLGLGLTVASRVVKAMSGSIQVQSTPNRGSTFRIEIPFSLPVHSVSDSHLMSI